MDVLKNVNILADSKNKIISLLTSASEKVVDMDWIVKQLCIPETRLAVIHNEVDGIIATCEAGKIESYKKNIPYHTSSKLIKKSAFKTAAIGSITSLPAALPVVGTVGAVVTGTAIDLVYLLKVQIELCYAIAFAYDAEMDVDELKNVVLALMGFSSSTGLIKSITADTLKIAVDELAKKYLVIGFEKASSDMVKKITSRLIGRSFKLIPLINIPISASINITSTMMVGNQARRYFSFNH